MARAPGVAPPSNGGLEPPQPVESPRCSSATTRGRPFRPGADRASCRAACGGRAWRLVHSRRGETAAEPLGRRADPPARAGHVVRVLKPRRRTPARHQRRFQERPSAWPWLPAGSHHPISSRRRDIRAARASSQGPLRSDRTCNVCSDRNDGRRCGSWSTPADAIRRHKGGAWRSTPRRDPSILAHHCVNRRSGQRSGTARRAVLRRFGTHRRRHLLVNGSLTFSIYHKRHVGVFHETRICHPARQ